LRGRNGLAPITPTSAATKPPTGAQQTVAGYASRMDNANKMLDNLEQVGSSMLGTVSGQGWFPNVLKSSERQQMEQAQRDFINAKLRQESGAAIAQSEFDSASKQYFPQPGDNAAVIEQKRRNREQVIASMQQAAGSAYSTQIDDQNINDILSQFGL